MSQLSARWHLHARITGGLIRRITQTNKQYCSVLRCCLCEVAVGRPRQASLGFLHNDPARTVSYMVDIKVLLGKGIS